MPQTSITTDPERGIEGMHSKPLQTDEIESWTVNQAGGIPYGCFATRQSENKIKLPTTSAEVTDTGIGFVFRDPTQETPPLVGSVENGQLCAVMTHGKLFVKTEGAVTQRGKVFVRITASGGNTQLGACRADADTATAIELTRAKWAETTTAAGYAELEVW